MEKKTATHSSILAWEIPWTERPGGLQSMGSHRVRQDLVHRVIMRNVLNKAQCLIAKRQFLLWLAKLSHLHSE